MTAEKMAENFITNIRLLAKSRDSLGRIERQVGVSTGYLSRFKRGNINIPLVTAIRFAEAVGEDVMDLCMKDYKVQAIDDKIEQLEQEIAALKEEKDRRTT